MPKIVRSDDNLVAVPTNVSILSNGYVYYNKNHHLHSVAIRSMLARSSRVYARITDSLVR